VWDVFGTLGAGGQLVLPEPGSLMAPPALAQYVLHYGVTHWNSVPQLAQMLCDWLTGSNAHTCTSIRYLLMSGDAIPRTLPARLQALLPQLQQVSMGGEEFHKFSLSS